MIPLPGYLAGPVRILSHYPGYVAAAAHNSGRQLLVLLACGAVVIVLLWIPVLGDRFNGFLSVQGPKVAPRIFFLGLLILLIGLIARSGILDIAGGCLMGIVILAVILDNY